MTPEDAKMIEALHAYVAEAATRGASYDDFWDGFDKVAGDFGKRAMAEGANADLTEQYCDVLASADDAGYTLED